MLKEYHEARLEKEVAKNKTNINNDDKIPTATAEASIDTIDLLNESESSSSTNDESDGGEEAKGSVDRSRNNKNKDDDYIKKLDEFNNCKAEGQFLDDFEDFTQNPWDDESF